MTFRQNRLQQSSGNKIKFLFYTIGMYLRVGYMPFFYVKRASRNEGEKRYRLRCITDAVEQENASR